MTTTNTDDKNVAAIVSLSRTLAEKDANIVSLQKTLAIARDDCERLSKICDEYRSERDECKEELIDANMALQSQQARPLADVEEELVSVKDQLAEVSRQRDELLLSVIDDPKSFVEAINYLDSALRLDLHTKITAIRKIREITGLSLANASSIVLNYVGRKMISDEDKFWNGVEEDKKKEGGCAGCSGGCCGNRVLVIPDDSQTGSIRGYPEQVYDTAGNVPACTMGCADTQSVSVFPDSEWPHDKAFNTDPTTTTLQPPSETEGTNDADWHLEDDEIPF